MKKGTIWETSDGTLHKDIETAVREILGQWFTTTLLPSGKFSVSQLFDVILELTEDPDEADRIIDELETAIDLQGESKMKRVTVWETEDGTLHKDMKMAVEFKRNTIKNSLNLMLESPLVFSGKCSLKELYELTRELTDDLPKLEEFITELKTAIDL